MPKFKAISLGSYIISIGECRELTNLHIYSVAKKKFTFLQNQMCSSTQLSSQSALPLRKDKEMVWSLVFTKLLNIRIHLRIKLIQPVTLLFYCRIFTCNFKYGLQLYNYDSNYPFILLVSSLKKLPSEQSFIFNASIVTAFFAECSASHTKLTFASSLQWAPLYI